MNPNKLFSPVSAVEKSFKQIQDTIFREIFMAKKPMTAEDEKKKQAYYYSKKEKKAKEVKK